MEYRANDFCMLPRQLHEDCRQADSLWGEGYGGLDYLGSEIEGPDRKGFYRSTDFFQDPSRALFWHARYFRVSEGEIKFFTESERLFGHRVPEWDRASKEKKK